MKKDELINILLSMPGNPEIVFEDSEMGYKLVKEITKVKLHEGKNGEGYIEDWDYDLAEPGTYTHDAFYKDVMEFIKIVGKDRLS